MHDQKCVMCLDETLKQFLRRKNQSMKLFCTLSRLICQINLLICTVLDNLLGDKRSKSSSNYKITIVPITLKMKKECILFFFL